MPSRGRPPVDDSPTLRKMAMKFAAGRASKVSPAVRQIFENPTDSDIRRLQRKWRKEGGRYLVEAHRTLDRQAEQSRQAAFQALTGSSFFEAVNPFTAQFSDLARRVEVITRPMTGLAESIEQTVRALQSRSNPLAGLNLELTAARLLPQESPAGQAMREIARLHEIANGDRWATALGLYPGAK